MEKRIKSSVIASVVDVALRSDQMMSVVAAATEDSQPTHFVLVLPMSRASGLIASLEGVIPVSVTLDDFE